ncbi:MAG: S41 family peptidase [Clostridia bacterium]|nr:S41 family peptidase [Clostridia bacterium]
MSDRRKILAVLVVIMMLLGVAATAVLLTNFKHVGTMVKVITIINNEYIEPVTTTQMVDGAIAGIVKSLGDPYSVYMEPKTYSSLQKDLKGIFGGVGISVGMRDEHLTVIAPIKDTPAFRAGIKAGDVIYKINEKDAFNMDLETAINLIQGKEGTKVKLTMLRKGKKKPLEFELIREIIVAPSVEGKILDGTDIAYVQLTQFKSNTGQELGKTLQELNNEGFKGIILDLRDNPGGDLDAAVDVAKFFVPKESTIVSIKYRNGDEDKFVSDAEPLEVPLVIIINENSASASEIVAGAVKDSKTGTLVGLKTFGKGVVQSIFPLDNGAGLKLTTAKYYTPKGSDIHKKGISPDVEVKQPQAKGEEEVEDLQLEKAIGIVKAKIK